MIGAFKRLSRTVDETMTTMTKKELATIAGYTYRRLYDIDRDQPAEKKLFVESEGGKYDLAIFVQRWVEYNVSSKASEADDLDVVKARHEVVKTRKTELEVARMMGKFVEIQEVHRLWGNIATIVRGRFVNLARKLAPALVMIDDPDRIEEIIDRDVRDALNMIANTPLPGEGMQVQEEDFQTPDEEDDDE